MADRNWFSATVFLRMFSRTRPRGPIFNTSRIRVDLQCVNPESGTYLDLKSLKKEFTKSTGPEICHSHEFPVGPATENNYAITEQYGAFSLKDSC